MHVRSLTFEICLKFFSVDPEYNLAKVCPEIDAHLKFVRENVPEWAPIEQRMMEFLSSEVFLKMKSSNTRKTQF